MTSNRSDKLLVYQNLLTVLTFTFTSSSPRGALAPKKNVKTASLMFLTPSFIIKRRSLILARAAHGKAQPQLVQLFLQFLDPSLTIKKKALNGMECLMMI